MFSDVIDAQNLFGLSPNVNWFEIALSNSRGLRQSINVPFKPDHVFIYNPTDANLYMSIGADTVPDESNSDLTCLSQSYYMFTPTDTDTWQFGVLLDSPVSNDPCNIIFAAGESQQDRDKLKFAWDFNWAFSFLNLRAGNIYFLRLGNIFNPVDWCHESNFIITKDGWTGTDPLHQSYILGTGWHCLGAVPSTIRLTFPEQVQVKSIEMTFFQNSPLGADPNFHETASVYLGGVLQFSEILTTNQPTGTYTVTFNLGGTNPPGDRIDITISGGVNPRIVDIQSISVEYNGIPFTTVNC